MMEAIQSPVITLLQSKTVDFDVINIPLSDDKKPIRNLEELLTAKGLDSTSVVRSILFRGESGKFILLAVAGKGRADWGLLRQHLGERKLRMAEYDEVLEATGYRVGAVPPLALPEHIKIILDDSVNAYETVVIGSGVLGYALALKKADLLNILTDVNRGSFVKE